MDCIFCAIVAGDIPSAKVHEDDRTLGFLDIQPLREGHALVIPKHHAQRLEDLGADDAHALIAATQGVVRRLKGALGVDDATIAINNGPDAGQEVPHVHIHIVPRQAGDGPGPIHALFPDRPRLGPEDIEALAQKVAA